MEIRMLEDSIELEGYINVTERKSKIMTDKSDGKKFVEIIKQGTFKRALDSNPNIVMLLDHNFDKQIGKIGDNVELSEDSIGLHYRATIKDAETIELAKNNRLVGCSFGFNKAKGTKTTGVLETRNINELDLKEVSILSDKKNPAYSGCSVELRSLDNESFTLEIRELDDYMNSEDIPNFDVYIAELFILKNKQI
ncbi:hypothetical protein AXY43_23080 [Clostridium sp. MF28]|uniref:HK97 family phage prohead protease n=1 Tax=Clostridium TaxID=1485 RepID=UPI000CF8AB6D|nr:MULTISPECIES: HK97 family phage prohead protease [Clostridium]AVK50665.1 hypothetical protein AXY43_23080 [Clostridium sp. MF28]PSM59005.1 HK97 family phage prohead protease [Clostridium diolis]